MIYLHYYCLSDGEYCERVSWKHQLQQPERCLICLSYLITKGNYLLSCFIPCQFGILIFIAFLSYMG